MSKVVKKSLVLRPQRLFQAGLSSVCFCPSDSSVVVMETPKRHSFTHAFKLKVVRQAEIVGNRQAAKLNGIDEKNVRRWRAVKENLFNSARSRRAFRKKVAATQS